MTCERGSRGTRAHGGSGGFPEGPGGIDGDLGRVYQAVFDGAGQQGILGWREAPGGGVFHPRPVDVLPDGVLGDGHAPADRSRARSEGPVTAPGRDPATTRLLILTMDIFNFDAQNSHQYDDYGKSSPSRAGRDLGHQGGRPTTLAPSPAGHDHGPMNRQVGTVAEKNTHEAPLLAEHAQFLITTAARAPSVHNTQPWRFGVGRSGVELYCDPRRKLRADPLGREMIISCGAALFGLRLAVRGLGYLPVVELLPDPSRSRLLARVGMGAAAPVTRAERRMLEAVRHLR